MFTGNMKEAINMTTFAGERNQGIVTAVFMGERREVLKGDWDSSVFKQRETGACHCGVCGQEEGGAWDSGVQRECR